MKRLTCSVAPVLLLWTALAQPVEPAVRIATFDVDATPPLGSAMAYDPVKRLDDLTLRCRGIVLTGAGQPIVLCAVDWIGIANQGHEAFRAELAEAAGTVPARVAVHAVHQHDAPGCDFTAEKIIGELGVNGYSRFDGAFHRQVIRRAADAIRAAMPNARPVTHYGCGEAAVIQVASQRRIQGPDGRIRASRTSSTRDPTIRAEPEGVIDPVVSVLSFWDGASPVAVLSFYACHRIDVTCLRIGNTRMLHLPGELFVEYQLAAKAMRPDLRVMMAAYGDYGPGYIGTAVAYLEGGYETQPTSSNTTPEAEAVLMAAMRGLLGQADRDAE